MPTTELGGSLLLSLMALVAPLFTLLVIAVLLWLAFHRLRRISRGPRPF